MPLAPMQKGQLVSLDKLPEPPLRLISRLIVEVERFKCLAIERMDKSATVPLEIHSRSDWVKTRLDGLRMGGRSNNRPIELRDSPFFQRPHISCFCAGVYLIRAR
jgi:hypothetical protein